MPAFFRVHPCAARRATAAIVLSLVSSIGVSSLASESVELEQPLEILPGSPTVRADRLAEYSTTTAWGGQRLVAGKLNGRKTLNLINTVDAGESPMIDHIVLDASTLALMNRYSPYFAVGPHYLAVAVRDRRLTGSLNSIPGGESVAIDTALASDVFEESTLALVLAALPLAEGYSGRLPRLAVSASNSSFSTGSVDFTVTGREQVEGGDGQAYRCWVVEAQWSGVDYSEIHWIAEVPPYSIRKKATFPDGRQRESGFVTVSTER
ncbi:MAG: hypothetical protein AAGD86_02285 [Pseudomonadota bacterium]